ncbi:MAG: dual specificity protein kinase kns1 [Alectoria sarmentosa]|nr:MAG: dual specificity protein kinase kns1 [Alectoria sarmentosa]
MTTSQSTSALQGPRKRERRPDWHEFYKNGPPKEIIVIDDDSPQPSSRKENERIPQQPQPQPQPQTTARAAEHANKKRRTGQTTAYDAARDQQAFSHARTYSNGNSGSNTISTDRTTSLQTTAPTSLGSHSSHGTSGTYVDDGVVGQKRKRVTRQQIADEKKRKEIEVVGDAYSAYVPPPKPPIKARDVHVPSIKDKIDDDDGHYIVTEDMPIGDRYQVNRLLGQGTFGKVVEAYDRRTRSKCAIKIIRSVQKYRDASRIELRVLQTLSHNDRQNRNKCIHLRDCFDFRNHICIVTDLLGQSVFDFLKGNGFVPFPSSQIQSFARQLFTSVAFLHDLNLIHTDLKPENILLVGNSYQTFTYNRNIPSSSTTVQRVARQRRVLLDTEIRLIDFGSATFDDEYHSTVVSTRHYRAPEIILNLGWSYPCDIWSIGCILVEFFTGDALFQTHDNLEHLAMMESVCGGKIEPKLVRQVQGTGRNNNRNQAAAFFTRSLKLDYPNQETSKASKKYVRAMKNLHEVIPAATAFNKQFLDLLGRIFMYDPKQRLTAKQALKHPWFKETITDDGTEAARIRVHDILRVLGTGLYVGLKTTLVNRLPEYGGPRVVAVNELPEGWSNKISEVSCRQAFFEHGVFGSTVLLSHDGGLDGTRLYLVTAEAEEYYIWDSASDDISRIEKVEGLQYILDIVKDPSRYLSLSRIEPGRLCKGHGRILEELPAMKQKNR